MGSKRGQHNTTSAARVAQAEALATRRAAALDLRKQGGSYREIAAAIREAAAQGDLPGATPDYNESAAYGDVQAELRRLREQNQELAEDVRDLEVQRLDALLAVAWPKAMNGDLFAFDRVLKVSESRRRLFGLDAPIKHQEVQDPIDWTLVAPEIRDAFIAGRISLSDVRQSLGA